MLPSFWDVYAGLYDELGGTRPYSDLHERAFALLGLRRGERVLDVGCGTGLFLQRLARDGERCQLTGVDGSAQMLARARQKLPSHARLLLQDVSAGLPLPDASQDAVVSMQMLYTQPDPRALLAEIRRVLAPGGRLILVNPHTAAPNDVALAHYRGLRGAPEVSLRREARIALAYAAILTLNQYIARRARQQTYHFLSPEELAEMLRDEGFQVGAMQERIYGDTSVLLRASRT